MSLFSKVGMDSELKYIDNILIAIVARFCTQLRRNFVFIDIIYISTLSEYVGSSCIRLHLAA